jgi:hypothetical protein
MRCTPERSATMSMENIMEAARTGWPSATPILDGIGRFIRSRWGVVTLATIVIGAGLWFGWRWLVAAGLAPIVISLLPCAAMCAIGLRYARRESFLLDRRTRQSSRS